MEFPKCPKCNATIKESQREIPGDAFCSNCLSWFHIKIELVEWLPAEYRGLPTMDVFQTVPAVTDSYLAKQI